MKNCENAILKTENAEKTANTKTYNAIFRIWLAVSAVKGEFPLPIHPNNLLALYRAKKIQMSIPRQQMKKNAHCPKLRVCPALTAVSHAWRNISGKKSRAQTITTIPANNDTLNTPKTMQTMLRSMEIKWAYLFNAFSYINQGSFHFLTHSISLNIFLSIIF